MILLIVGIAIGITEMAICAGGWDKAEERERRIGENLGLLYPENKIDRQRGNADGQKGGSI